MSAKYPYNTEYQTGIVSLILKDPTFYSRYKSVLQSSYFEFKHLATLVRLVEEHHDTYQKVPDKVSLRQALQEFSERYKLASNVIESYLSTIDTVYRHPTPDMDATIDRITDFGRRRAIKEAISKTVDMIDDPEADMDDVGTILSRANRVGTEITDTGTDFFQKALDIPKLYDAPSEKGVGLHIPTGLPTLDASTRGGPSTGQVVMILGMPGAGKSMLIASIGAHAVMNGYPTLHITLGDLQEVDVGLRYAARFTELGMDEILDDPEGQYVERMKTYIDDNNMYLKIKYWPARVADINMIRGYISQRIQEDKVQPRVIIVDYPDKMRYQGDSFVGLGHLYDHLNMIANDFGCVVYAPHQPTRYAPQGVSEVMTMANTQESWKIPQVVDIWMSLNQSPQEHRASPPVCRVWVDKCRRGKAKYEMPCIIDYARCHVYEDPTAAADDEGGY